MKRIGMAIPCKKSFRTALWSSVILAFAAGFMCCRYYSVVRVLVLKITSGPLESGNAHNSRTLEQTPNNNEQNIDWGRVFYNKVSKCGSSTLISLMKVLTSMNRFAHYYSTIFDRRLVDPKEQARIVKLVKNTPAPCSLDRHVFFINFTKYNERPPVYINMIRDPVERYISVYFYRRTGKRKPWLSDKWYHKNFEECVLLHDPECTLLDGKMYEMQLPYFCGQEPRCMYLNDRWAINRAKQNIERHYAVVGTLEHLNMTLQVLERVLPQFFAGVYDVYITLGLHKNRNPYRKQVSEEVKDLLRANMTTDYELYHFVQQRLYRQYQSWVQNSHEEELKKAKISAEKVYNAIHSGLTNYHYWH